MTRYSINMDKSTYNSTDAQKRDMEYMAKLAQEMKRSVPSIGSESDNEDAPCIDIDKLAEMIDVNPGSLGAMNGTTMNAINDIKKRAKHYQQPVDPYSSALQFGEAYLGLDEPSPDMENDSNDTSWSMTPNQVINGIDDAVRTLGNDETVPIQTSDGKRIVDIVISNGKVILMTE